MLSHFSEGKCIRYTSKSPFLELNLQKEPDFTGLSAVKSQLRDSFEDWIYIKITP